MCSLIRGRLFFFTDYVSLNFCVFSLLCPASNSVLVKWPGCTQVVTMLPTSRGMRADFMVVGAGAMAATYWRPRASPGAGVSCQGREDAHLGLLHMPACTPVFSNSCLWSVIVQVMDGWATFNQPLLVGCDAGSVQGCSRLLWRSLVKGRVELEVARREEAMDAWSVRPCFLCLFSSTDVAVGRHFFGL